MNMQMEGKLAFSRGGRKSVATSLDRILLVYRQELFSIVVSYLQFTEL